MMRSLRSQDIIKESWSSFCVTGIFGLRPFELCKIKLFGYLYIISLSICYYGLFYYSLKNSDEIFDKKLKMFNVELNYKKYMRKDVVHIFGIIMFTILMGLTEYYSLINDGSTYMYDLTWAVNLFPQIINSIAISTFVVILAKIRRRLSMINNSIVELEYLKKNEVCTIVSTEINNVFKLKLLREMYKICDNIALKINNAYGFILLMSLSLFFIAMCAHLKIVYSTFGIQNDVIDCVVDTMWTCFYFGKFVYIIDACQSYLTENESFARQVGNRDIRINACNFVAIDYSLLAKVVLALTAYVFFLSQFSCTK
ncbi:hypothetical protein PV327_008305 [Microctonus hyperodae]|uniref:Gustatory receptor n=1 Tax=Microctonus hyperodae TaxID=165561 RepID=A0AA39KGZ0_MICHY|nr:hypothetical protein PV327_008305 [Microctonus hyperodae]